MRGVLIGLVAVCGVVMVLGAGFLMIDKMVSQNMRDDTRTAIDDGLDQMEDSRGRGRFGRMTRRVVEGMRALDRGIFFKSGVDLAAVLPPVPEGWAMREYAPGDAQAITGHAYKPSSITQNATQSALARFQAASQTKGTQMLRVYEGDTGLIALRLELSKKDMRALDRADASQIAGLMQPAARDRGGKSLMTVDGVVIRGAPKETQTPTGQVHRAEYLHLRFALGRVMRGELIATAPAREVLALVQRMNMAEIWNALPEAARADRRQNAGLSARLPQN